MNRSVISPTVGTAMDSSSGGGLPMSTAADDDSNDAFESPVIRASGSVMSKSVTKASESPAPTGKRPNPYGFDARGYSWLRGVVSQDRRTRVWKVQYSSDAAIDQYGGSLTLDDHPHLQHLESGDVVLVDGQLDAGVADEEGKPVFQIRSLQLMQPK